MARFRTPRRRRTRQESGFHVAGEGTGSTVRIETSIRITPRRGRVAINAALPHVRALRLFNRPLTVIGAGFYLRTEGPAKASGILSFTAEGSAHREQIQFRHLHAQRWCAAGALAEVALAKSHGEFTGLRVDVEVNTDAPVSVFGLTIGPLQQEYLLEHDLFDAYKTKTHLYVPELLYHDPTEESVSVNLQVGRAQGDGEYVVCKSCNRCARFLPIDVHHERNTLSYSNHCVARAPCTHPAFSRFAVARQPARHPIRLVNGNVVARYGFQLECRACKKFFVNLPLNPLRNSTQHREDSLRRRALEVLVNSLLGTEWIYHTHRLETDTEFDVYIWESFGRACFNCGRALPAPNDMDLDHTMPLAYLWPLDDTATCLCPTCNSAKRDKFPVDFYSSQKRRELARLTGLPKGVLDERRINEVAAKRLLERVDWFFDDFLTDSEYQKVREGKRTADLILHAVQAVLAASGLDADLIGLYVSRTGRTPRSVTIQAH